MFSPQELYDIKILTQNILDIAEQLKYYDLTGQAFSKLSTEKRLLDIKLARILQTPR